ncbi:MAG TPA: methionyl-tRNA formyltransferase [Gammaproteobacteria bacterium]|nr:methionyl-tRNA formyltransferase [Gammaproteobacteria bacterium]
MPRALRVVFAGTPAFAVPALDALLDSPHSVVAAYTQPDRPAGRGRRLTASPVKQRALDAGVPVHQPLTLKDNAEHQALQALAPDLMVVVAYGLILPRAILALPPLGCINIHASLLPRWRGAAPIHRAILAGDRETGVSIMQMNAGLDTGPVLARATTPIASDDTAETLHDRLAALGAEALLPALDALAAGAAEPEPQPAEGVTYAVKLQKTEARLDWQQPAVVLDCQVRALQPWPVADTLLDGAQLRVWQAEPMPDAPVDAPPATVVAAGRDGIDVATGAGLLRIRAVQRAGGKRTDAAAFARGTGLVGKVLGRV